VREKLAVLGRTWSASARVTVGLILLFAGLAKFSAAPPMWFSVVIPMAAKVWVLAVLLELFLGIVLITGIGWGRVAWCVGMGLFAAFATISGTLAWQGESTCGCFGRLAIQPWRAMMIDGCAVVLLLAARQSAPHVVHAGRCSSLAAWCGMVGLLVLPAIPAAWLCANYGESLVVSNPVAARPGSPGTWVPFQVEVRNRGAGRARIYGAPASRHVRLATALPLVIEPNGVQEIDFQLFCGGSRGLFSTWLHLVTDVAGQREITIYVRGRVQ
jgi:hypothetical protein